MNGSYFKISREAFKAIYSPDTICIILLILIMSFVQDFTSNDDTKQYPDTQIEHSVEHQEDKKKTFIMSLDKPHKLTFAALFGGVALWSIFIGMFMSRMALSGATKLIPNYRKRIAKFCYYPLWYF